MQPRDTSEAEALLTEARREIEQGRLERADELCCRALAAEPHHAGALHLMGAIAGQSGRNQEAVELLEQALARNPADAMAHTNLAVALHGLGRSEEALAHLDAALELTPESTHTLRNYAVVLSDLGRWTEAAQYLERWSKLEPENAAVYEWIGDWHSRQNLREQAIPYYLKTLELDPGRSEAANNLGACLADAGRRESALALLCKIVEMHPGHAGAWGNLGVAAKNFGDMKTALRCFDRVLELEPGDARAQWNRSLSLLGMGRLTEGWAAYDWRFQSGAVPRERPSNQPRWEGGDPAGTKILVWAEQGLGDQLLFFSMVSDLMRAGARCVVECDWRLVKLLERSFAGAEVIPYGAPPHPRTQQADIDFQISVGGLARWFRPDLDRFPKKGGYVVPDPVKVSQWKERLDALGEGLKAGICWRSGVTRGSRSMYYSQLNQWGPILTMPEVHFINLQYGECSEELREAERLFGTRMHIWNDMDLKNDQDGLAALISALDLVISAGTAVDSMAGAVGVPTWVLMRSIGDWWSLGTNRCPWSPSVRPFLCGAAAPWEPVIGAIAAELGKVAAARSGVPAPHTVECG
jgi:tetratricopeptide (TPR) repeat protein